jgi:hypothetical protein
MNCKQGDLAILVRSNRGSRQIGKIVRCVRLASGIVQSITGDLVILNVDCGDWWEVDAPLMLFTKSGFVEANYCPDYCLKPLIDGDGTDEMIAIVGKPKKASA